MFKEIDNKSNVEIDEKVKKADDNINAQNNAYTNRYDCLNSNFKFKSVDFN
jgi:hypothetical protein